MALKLLAPRSQFLCLGEASLSQSRTSEYFILFSFLTFILQIFLLNYASEKALSNDKQSVLKRKPFFFPKEDA